MLTAIITVFLTFMLTGLVGNWILQGWQYRNWLNQQQVAGEEKEYIELKKLWDDIAIASGKRLSLMRRLVAVLRNKDDVLVKQRLTEYDAALADWNASLNSFLVRLTLYASWDHAWMLEHYIQSSFVTAGGLVEMATSKRLSNEPLTVGTLTALHREMNSLNRKLFEFNRDILDVVRKQKQRTYYGARISLEPKSVHRFGTWELVKALFQPAVPPYRVIRTPAELGFPSGSGL